MISHKQSLAHLSNADPVMAGIIRRVKIKLLKPRTDHFYSLVRAIVNQQLSGKAADTILDRFVTLFPGKKFPAPDDILKMSNKKLRSAGLSFQKISYIKNLSSAVKNGQLNFSKLKKMDDEEIIIALTEIKGIGRWTAEMFLMFSLNRPNVFSVGDLGLRNGLKKLYKLDAKRHHRKLEKLLSLWHPHKTLASRHLWASLEFGD